MDRQAYKRYIPARVRHAVDKVRYRWFKSWAQESYSQNGEDMILDWCFENRPTGFYVDIGAHHPKRYSNTYRLYRRGWRGLNVDANPGSMGIFRKIRPRDINVEAAVGPAAEDLIYYAFEDAAVNTFDRAMALEQASRGRAILREISIKMVTLEQLFDQYVPPGVSIDLLSIDVEGLDYQALTSNDWNRYRPDYIFTECLDSLSLGDVASDKVTRLLSKYGYCGISKTSHTVLYKRMNDTAAS